LKTSISVTISNNHSELLQHDVFCQVLDEILAEITNDKESIVSLPREYSATIHNNLHTYDWHWVNLHISERCGTASL